MYVPDTALTKILVIVTHLVQESGLGAGIGVVAGIGVGTHSAHCLDAMEQMKLFLFPTSMLFLHFSCNSRGFSLIFFIKIIARLNNCIPEELVVLKYFTVTKGMSSLLAYGARAGDVMFLSRRVSLVSEAI